jgi:hypothetical protein
VRGCEKLGVGYERVVDEEMGSMSRQLFQEVLLLLLLRCHLGD